MTIKSIFSKPETILYPVIEKTAPEGLKGHIDVDMSQCILCSICARTCPADAIEVDKTQNLWSINRFACVQCGSCTLACPKECLTMEPTYQKPAASMHKDVFYKPAVTEEEKAAKEAQNAAKLDEAQGEKDTEQEAQAD